MQRVVGKHCYLREQSAFKNGHNQKEKILHNRQSDVPSALLLKWEKKKKKVLWLLKRLTTKLKFWVLTLPFEIIPFALLNGEGAPGRPSSREVT